MAKKPLIVGIDPGNTSAIAALNLDGELELLESQREFGREEIIQRLVDTGYPLVITSDRSEMPSTVDKIASSLGTERFIPENDLSRQRKKELGDGENSHEKDAYASALHAFKQLRKRIRKINQMSERDEHSREEIAKRYFSEKELQPTPANK